ncbi:MAG: hypothetical protein ABH952_10690 [Candidatus Omnitrophota bacterium]
MTHKNNVNPFLAAGNCHVDRRIERLFLTWNFPPLGVWDDIRNSLSAQRSGAERDTQLLAAERDYLYCVFFLRATLENANLLYFKYVFELLYLILDLFTANVSRMIF